MSESVKIGGIGKNPAIDKINSLNSIDVKNYAVKKMEQLLLTEDFKENITDINIAQVDFSKADWKGKNGIRYESASVAGNKLHKRTNDFENTKKLGKTI